MLLGTVSLWALNFTVSKYILEEGFHPLAYSSVRYAAAALIFAAITLAWEGSLRIGKREVPLIAGGTIVLFLNQLCFIYALRFTTATTVALLFGTLPIFTALLARGTGVERLSVRFWAAALLSFGGVALVAIGSGGDLSADLKGALLAAGLDRLRLRRARPARGHESPLVHRHRPGRTVARVDLREPAAVSGRDRGPNRAGRADHDGTNSGRPRDRRRDCPRASRAARSRAARRVSFSCGPERRFHADRRLGPPRALRR